MLSPVFNYALCLSSVTLTSSLVLYHPLLNTDKLDLSLSASPDIAVPRAGIEPASVSLPQLALNLSRGSSNLSVAIPSALCDGNRYGREVKSGSCIDALEIIPDLERTVSFGPRAQGSFMLGV